MNIRFFVLCSCLLFSAASYYLVTTTIPTGITQLIKLEQIYAITSLILLYVTLLAGPFCYTFTNFLWQKQYLNARRALGVGSFYFALLHSLITFFGQLDGFDGLGFLDKKYLFALTLGFVGLIILWLLTITSVDWIIKKIHFKNWKLLHRFVYLASLLIIIHTLMIGTHFSNFFGLIPQISFFALTFLLILEAPRFIKKRGKLIMTGILIIIYLVCMYPFSNNNVSLNNHATHMQLARQKQTPYTITLIKPDNMEPNRETTFRFLITDKKTKQPVTLFKTLYEKPLHLIVVNEALTSFRHLHPTQEKNEFILTTEFPASGTYHLYLTYQPWNALEQQAHFVLQVGNKESQGKMSQPMDMSLTKIVNNFEISLVTDKLLNAENLSKGNQLIRFMIRDSVTKEPITSLKPYLGAFGHLTMINTRDYTSLHVHPVSLNTPAPTSRGGPAIDFRPIGLYGPILPGIYRVFLECNPDGTILTADFTIKIQ